MKLKEHGIVEGPLNALEAFFIQIEFQVLEPDFASTLDWKLWVEQSDRIDIRTRFGLDLHPLEHWPMVTAHVLFMTTVLKGFCSTSGVIFEKNSVSVRGTLLVFVFEVV